MRSAEMSALVVTRFVLEGWYPGDFGFNYTSAHEKQISALFPCFIGSREVREGVIRLIERGLFDIASLVTDLVSWDNADRTYNRLFADDRNSMNGIVIDWKTE